MSEEIKNENADWRKALYEVPELGFKWRRFSSPRCVRLVGFFNAVLPGGKLDPTSAGKHVHEIAIDRAADGVRWQAVATIDGVESFTITSGCQWKAERGALAAWRTITRHTCRGTRRNIEAAARKATGMRIPREPVYNASDWHYIRFRVCNMLLEIANDSLEMIVE